MTALDHTEHSPNLYTSKRRIVKRIIFGPRQDEQPYSTIAPGSPSAPTFVPTSTSTTLITDAQSSSLALVTAVPQPVVSTQWATVTFTRTLSPSAITTTAYVATAKRSRPTSTGNTDVQSAQAGQNQQVFPIGTVGAVIMSVLFVVMVGFVIYVARKRFGFPGSNALKKLRKDAMAMRITNAILESKHLSGPDARRPVRRRSLLSLVTLSSFRGRRSRPESQVSSLHPTSPSPASLEGGMPRDSQPSSAPMPSTSRRTHSISSVSSSPAAEPKSFRAFLENSMKPRPEGARANLQDDFYGTPDDLPALVFLTEAPKKSSRLK